MSEFVFWSLLAVCVVCYFIIGTVIAAITSKVSEAWDEFGVFFLAIFWPIILPGWGVWYAFSSLYGFVVRCTEKAQEKAWKARQAAESKRTSAKEGVKAQAERIRNFHPVTFIAIRKFRQFMSRNIGCSRATEAEKEKAQAHARIAALADHLDKE